MDKMLGPSKKKKTNQEKLEEALGPNVGDLVVSGDAKIEDLEAPPAWEADPNDPPDSPVDISSRSVHPRPCCCCRVYCVLFAFFVLVRGIFCYGEHVFAFGGMLSSCTRTVFYFSAPFV